MDIKAEYEKLETAQRQAIDDGVQEAINGVEMMRGVNSGSVSPIYSDLDDAFVLLRELQEAGWFND